MNIPSFVYLMIVPLVSSPLVYLVGRLWPRRSQLANRLALLAILLTWVPFVFALTSAKHEFNIESLWLRFDGISILLTACVLVLGTLVLIFSGPYMEGESGTEKYYAMLLAMMGMMIGLGCATDLFNLWIWFEGMAVSSYLLVAFYREQPASLEAGIKYLVQSALGSALVLMGIALVFAQAGSVELSGVWEAVSRSDVNRAGLLAAGALFIIGFGVKAALVPLHTWLPDAHSQAPSGISAMLSGVVIEAGLIAMLRALSALSILTPSWGGLLLAFGALNILMGNLLALQQTLLKRMLAYSSLSHMGYMLLGFGMALTAGNVLSAQGAFFHLFNHMLMKGLAFLAVGAFIYAVFLQNGSHASLTIHDMAGAAQKYPLAAFALSLALLGLGGLPPLAGFMSKWQIFMAGFQTGNLTIISLMIFMALNSVLSLAYYAPVVNAMYRNEPSQAMVNGKAMPFALGLPLMILLIGILVLGFTPSLIDGLTVPAARSFLSMFGM
ncbi:MAG: proton-conducting transporter membrane subunit [Anaerolineales bacterium]